MHPVTISSFLSFHDVWIRHKRPQKTENASALTLVVRVFLVMAISGHWVFERLLLNYLAGQWENISNQRVLSDWHTDDLTVGHEHVHPAFQTTVPRVTFRWRCYMHFGKYIQLLLTMGKRIKKTKSEWSSSIAQYLSLKLFSSLIWNMTLII